MFGWNKKNKRDEEEQQDVPQPLADGMGETLVPDPDDIPGNRDAAGSQGSAEQQSDSDVSFVDEPQAPADAADDVDVADWLSDESDESDSPEDAGTLTPDVIDTDEPQDAAPLPVAPILPKPGPGTMLPGTISPLAGGDGFAMESGSEAPEPDTEQSAIDDGTLDPAVHEPVRDRFGESGDRVSPASDSEDDVTSAGTVLHGPAEDPPADMDTAATQEVGDEMFSDMDTAQTFVPDADGGLGDDDFADFEENETVVHRQRPQAGDEAATVVSDSPDSISDVTTLFNQSMGPADESAVLEGLVEGAEHSSLMSLMGKSSHTGGLDRSLKIRNRPVKGDEPFSQAPDADYEIVNKLAEGGMGVVYLAKQTSLRRELAIKTLKSISEQEKKSFAKSGRMSQVTRQRREMFLSEALVTANLVHPNIVPIHDLCQTDDGVPFYSMKHVEGKPWNKHVTEMTEDENLDVLLKLADAVAYAHHNGVVNRDLKPENIMLGEFGEVIVLDWGLAIPAPDSGQAGFSSTATSFGAGTPAYMSPELWCGPPEKIGKHSDIYLLGAILFEIVTGFPPHEFPAPPKGASKTTIFRIIDSVVRPNEIRETEVESELLDIARKAMEEAPHNRYQSVQEFQVAVRAYQQHEESRHLSKRADELVGKADQSKAKGYSDYQTATALYREALVGWDDNFYAKKGLHRAELKYGQLAYERGDYDLGLQLVAGQGGRDFETLKTKLTKAKRRRGLQKWTTIGLLGFILIAGPAAAFVFKGQAEELETAHGSVSEMEAQKDAAVRLKSEAEEATAAAKQDAADAEEERSVAAMLASMALDEQEIAEQAAALAIEQKAAAIQEATLARSEAAKASQEAERALAVASDAKKAAQQADRAAEQAERATKAAKKEAAASDVEKKSQVASSHRLNRDYDTAIRHIEALLTELSTPELAEKLPPEDIEERRRELEAQKQQLSRRARRTDSPVELQQISSGGSLVAWCDQANDITIWQLTNSADTFPEAPTHRLTVAGDDPITDLKLLEDQSTVLATAGPALHVWNFRTGEHRMFRDEDDPRETELTAVESGNGLYVTGDAQGRIVGWNPKVGSIVFDYDTDTPTRALQLVPETELLLFAGSRANRSAVVQAFQLPTAGLSKLTRRGQLQYAVDSNRPPEAMNVSPNGNVLVISNSIDGDLLVLPRISGNGFPFLPPGKLAGNGLVQSAEVPSEKHTRPVNSIEFSSDSTHFVTTSDDRKIVVWELSGAGRELTARQVETLEGHGAVVTAAGFVGRGNDIVISTSRDRYARLWDVPHYAQDTGSIDESFDDTPDTDSAARGPLEGRPASQLSTVLLAGCPDDLPALTEGPRSRYRLTELPGEQPTGSYVVLNGDSNRVLRGGIQSVELTTDGSQIATGGTNGTALIWAASNGTPVAGASREPRFHARGRLFEEGHRFNVSGMQFLPPDQSLLLTRSFDGSLCLWQADPSRQTLGVEKSRLTNLGLMNAVAVSPDGRFIVTSVESVDDTNYGSAIWSVEQLLSGDTPQPIRQLDGLHSGGVTSLSYSADGAWIASGASDGRMAVWDAATGMRIASVRAHDRNTIVSGLAWIDSQHLLSAGLDGKLRLWTVQQLSPSQPGTITPKIRYHVAARSPIDQIAVAPSGDRFLTVSVTFGPRKQDGSGQRETNYHVLVWNIDQPDTIGEIRLATRDGKPPEAVSSVSWSPDESRVAVVADDHINIVDTSDWEVQLFLRSSHTGITDAVFRKSGAAEPDEAGYLATFDGNAAHLWDLRTYKYSGSFRPQDTATAVAMSHDPQHRYIAIGSRAIRIYDADESSVAYAQSLFKQDGPHKGLTMALAFAPGADDYRLLSGGKDGVVRLWQWDPDTLLLTNLMTWGLSDEPVEDVCWRADGSVVLGVTSDGVFLMNPDDPVATRVEFDAGAVGQGDLVLSCGAISPDGQHIAVGGFLDGSGASTGYVLTRDPANKTFQIHTSFSGHSAGGISCIDFVPEENSPYLVTAGVDGAAIIWNWHPRDPPGTTDAHEAYRFLSPQVDLLDAHRAAVTGLSISSNGVIATSSDDGTAIVWRNPLSRAANTLQAL